MDNRSNRKDSYPDTNCWIRYNGQGQPYRTCINEKQYRELKEERKKKQQEIARAKREDLEEEEAVMEELASGGGRMYKELLPFEIRAYHRAKMKEYRQRGERPAYQLKFIMD